MCLILCLIIIDVSLILLLIMILKAYVPLIKPFHLESYMRLLPIKRACPPKIACMIPHRAVEAKVSATLKLPFKENEDSTKFIKKMRIAPNFSLKLHLVPKKLTNKKQK
jgi:hypothetical protein